jgi:hypothetical protein
MTSVCCARYDFIEYDILKILHIIPKNSIYTDQQENSSFTSSVTSLHYVRIMEPIVYVKFSEPLKHIGNLCTTWFNMKTPAFCLQSMYELRGIQKCSSSVKMKMLVLRIWIKSLNVKHQNIHSF